MLSKGLSLIVSEQPMKTEENFCELLLCERQEIL